MARDGTPPHLASGRSGAAPAGVARFLDEVAARPLVRKIKRANLARLELRPGQRALEVGYGAGRELAAMARLVGPRGHAVGVERRAALHEAARRHAADAGVSVELVTGDIAALPLAADTFDAAYVERVLLHVADPAGAVAELARVLRPGGRLVLCDLDPGGYLFDLPDRELTRALVRYRAEREFPSGWAGRQLPRLLRAAGLADIRVYPALDHDAGRAPGYLLAHLRASGARAVADGALTAAEGERWEAILRASAKGGDWFHALPIISSAGRKSAGGRSAQRA